MIRVKTKIKKVFKKLDFIAYMVAVNAAVYIAVVKHMVKRNKDE